MLSVGGIITGWILNEQTKVINFTDLLTIRSEPKTDYPMNQSDLQTRVYQIGEHGKRLLGSRQKSSRYRSAVMMVVKICLAQLVKRNQQFITFILFFSFI